ncbi:MAG: hypothetical protein GF364_13545 [Candidatus Lokiarchaeota archaeon]|nr:hypothetical protein [Candidatus Lokiarchaeota archaeon]
MANIKDLELFMWLIIVGIFLLGTIYFSVLWKNSDEKLRKRLMKLVTIFFAAVALSRLFHLLSELYDGNEVLFQINQLFLIIALIFVIFTFEDKITQRSQNMLSIGLIIFEIIYIIIHWLYVLYPENEIINAINPIAQLLLAAMMGIAGLSIFFLYIKIALQSTGIVRKKGIMLSIGLLCLISSYLVFGLSMLSIPEQTIGLISFILTLIGMPMLTFGFRITKKG